MLDAVFHENAGELLKRAKTDWGDDGPVAVFDLSLDYGDIAAPFSTGSRENALRELGLKDNVIQRRISAAKEGLNVLQSDDTVRLWVTECRPEDVCGLCWMVNILRERPVKIQVVSLPRWVEGSTQTAIIYDGWHEVTPEEWEAFLPSAREIDAAGKMYLSYCWKDTVRENAPLRALISGRLHSVPADYYDPFIRMELSRLPNRFPFWHLIGNVYERQRLGIREELILWRVEEMVRQGILKEAGVDQQNRRLLAK